MAINAVISTQASIAGISVQASNTTTGNAQESYEATLAKAYSGTLGTRTDNDTGVVTLAEGHGVVTGKVVVSWTETGVRKTRYDVDAVVTANDVAIDAGDGDNLPAEDSTVSVAVQEDLAAAFDGDDLAAIVAKSTKDATLVFYDSGGAVLDEVQLYAGGAFVWQTGMGTTTPITGNAVANVVVGSRDTTATATFQLGLVQNV